MKCVFLRMLLRLPLAAAIVMPSVFWAQYEYRLGHYMWQDIKHPGTHTPFDAIAVSLLFALLYLFYPLFRREDMEEPEGRAKETCRKRRKHSIAMILQETFGFANRAKRNNKDTQ